MSSTSWGRTHGLRRFLLNGPRQWHPITFLMWETGILFDLAPAILEMSAQGYVSVKHSSCSFLLNDLWELYMCGRFEPGWEKSGKIFRYEVICTENLRTQETWLLTTPTRFLFFCQFKITESQGRQDLFRSLPEVILHKSPVQLRPSKRDFRAKKSIPALELFWVPTIVNFAGKC